MNTVDLVKAQCGAGKHPTSLWLNADKTLELRFSDGKVMPLPGAAYGDKRFNCELTREAWLHGTIVLARIMFDCGWSQSVELSLDQIRMRIPSAGHAEQLYPPVA